MFANEYLARNGAAGFLAMFWSLALQAKTLKPVWRLVDMCSKTCLAPIRHSSLAWFCSI